MESANKTYFKDILLSYFSFMSTPYNHFIYLYYCNIFCTNFTSLYILAQLCQLWVCLLTYKTISSVISYKYDTLK